MRSTTVVVALLVVGIGVVLVGAAGGAGSYDVSVSDSVATPPESVTVEGTTFTIASSGRVPRGGTIDVRVRTTVAEDYQINLYDSDKNVLAWRDANGSTSVTFDTGTLDPGTYVVGAVVDDPRDIQPVVVAGTRVGVDAPATVERGDAFTVRADLSPIGSAPAKSGAEAVIWNGADRHRLAMTRVDAKTYRIQVDDLPVGDYSLVVGVEGTDSIEGEKELVGLSDRSRISVVEPTTTTMTTVSTTQWPPETTRSSSGTETPTSTTAGTPNGSESATTSPGTTSIGTSTTAISTADVGSSPDQSTRSTSTPTSTGYSSPSPSESTEGGPITPRNSIGTTATEGSGDGFGAGLAVLALLAAIAIAGFTRQ